MALIQTIQKVDGAVLRIYKNNKTGRFINVLKHNYGTVVAHCDEMGNPRIVQDIRKNTRDVYVKAADGTTILKQKDKITALPHLIFNNIVTTLFR